MNQDNKSVFTSLPTVLKYQSAFFLEYGELKFLERTSKANRDLIRKFPRQHIENLDQNLPNGLANSLFQATQQNSTFIIEDEKEFKSNEDQTIIHINSNQSSQQSLLR